MSFPFWNVRNLSNLRSLRFAPFSWLSSTQCPEPIASFVSSSVSLRISSGRIDVNSGDPAFDDVKIHAHGNFCVILIVCPLESLGSTMMSSITCCSQLKPIGICAANCLKLATTSEPFTARPFAGALSWNVASPIFAMTVVASGCSTSVARKFSRTPVSVGVYHRWSNTVKPERQSLRQHQDARAEDVHARQRRVLARPQDAARDRRAVLRAVLRLVAVIRRPPPLPPLSSSSPPEQPTSDHAPIAAPPATALDSARRRVIRRPVYCFQNPS